MLEILPSLAMILGLLMLSALFSGTETAMTGASRERIWHLASQGDRRAGLVQRLIQDKERLIGALLVSNNVVNILAAALATELLLRLVGDAGVALATLAMTVLVVIFGEVLPKTYAIRHAEAAAMAVAPLIRLVVAALAPVTAVLRVLVNAMLRLFRGQPAGAGLVPVTEQVRGVLALAAAEGTGERHETQMLGGVLDLGKLEVRQVMVHRSQMETLDLDQPIEAILEQVRESGFTRYPVRRGDDPDTILGVLNVKDLIAAILARRGATQGIDILALCSQPWFVPDTTSLRRQLLAFRQRRAHLALVVDEYGVLQGLVTLEDVIEEIVGDIQDESDVEVSGVEVAADGTILVEGRVAVRDLNRRFGWDLPDDGAATIAGLVIEIARRIPDPGDCVEIAGHRVEVLRRQRHQLTQLRIIPVTTGADQAIPDV
jgi:Mg2+/Co2+ transporter CorB